MELVPRAGLAARAGAPGARPQGQLAPGSAAWDRLRAGELGPLRRVRVADRRGRVGRRPVPGVPPELGGANGPGLRRRGTPGSERPELAAATDLDHRPLAS